MRYVFGYDLTEKLQKKNGFFGIHMMRHNFSYGNS